jgi:ankyrin repeat protein
VLARERAVLARVMDALVNTTTTPQQHKRNALRLVAEHDNLVDFAERLIEGGVNVNGDYFLHVACLHGSVQIARRLIAAGSLVDAILFRGSTPLQ